MKCLGCDFDKYPLCAIRNIISATSVDSIICSNSSNLTPYLVCHNNSQAIENNHLNLKSSCDQCGLCSIACPFNNATIPYNRIEYVVFNDLGRLNIFFDSIIGDYAVVASEVKCKGNSREKRIDLLIKDASRFYFIKAITNTDKIPYYSRSYDNVVDYYSSLYPEYEFIKIMLIPSSKFIDNQINDSSAKTLEMLVDYFRR